MRKGACKVEEGACKIEEWGPAKAEGLQKLGSGLQSGGGLARLRKLEVNLRQGARQAEKLAAKKLSSC